MASTERPPIVAVMGHIDHGKSTLLDYIRKSNVAAGEAGGITQHVSAYEATHTPTQAGTHEVEPRAITFLDTPGHEAFKVLRTRGAAAADVAILVVAADEGVKPQTLDALEAIREAKTPFVVAFTKIDKNGANVDTAKNSLLEHEVYLEGLGGEVPYAAVSSKTGEGVPELLDLVLLTADLAGLTADPAAPACGFVLESSQDPKRGLSATLIMKDGTLSTGQFVVAGTAFAPVRFIENFLGKRIDSALPSQPVRVSGFNSLPPAGTPFITASSKKEAELLVKKAVQPVHTNFAHKSSDSAELPLVIKADVTGSAEAIKHELGKITHERANIVVLSADVGAVGESDVKSASAAKGVIIAFNVPVDASARDLALRTGVPIETFSIIYDLGIRVAALLASRAPHVTKEEERGTAKVLRTFSSTSHKQVLGVKLVAGTFKLGGLVKMLRREIELGRGKVSNLQQARADVKEIKTDGDFGIEIDSKTEAAPGDTIVSYELVES